MNNFCLNLIPIFLCLRNWSIGTHTTCVRTRITVPDALVILRRSERQNRFSVCQGEKTYLFPIQIFFDHDFRPGLTEAVAGQHVANRGFGLFNALGDDHTLAGGQPVLLDDDGGAGFADKFTGREASLKQP